MGLNRIRSLCAVYLLSMVLLCFLLVSCSTEGNPTIEKDLQVDFNISPQEEEKRQEEGRDKTHEDTHEIEELELELEAESESASQIVGDDNLQEQMFYAEEISDEIKERINGKSYGEDCTVPYEDLKYLRLSHIGFDAQTHLGEMIVNKAIAEDVIDIFKELYQAKYPIEKMQLIDEYDGDDNKSMATNNSSAFNYRPIEGTDRLSLHSYGLAIDINPQYNPYITYPKGEMLILPPNGEDHVDRNKENPYYIRHGDLCYQAFTKRGFTWGGDWENSKDYHHFQKRLDD